jgi:FlaA1/EpsC-like NDP-sugar epimerase
MRIIRQLEQVFESHRVMFNELKGRSYQHSIFAKERKTFKNKNIFWGGGGGGVGECVEMQRN